MTKEVDVREFRFAEEFSAALEGLELHIDDELVMLNKVLENNNYTITKRLYKKQKKTLLFCVYLVQ